MPSTQYDKGQAYVLLTREQIDLLLSHALWAIRTRELGPALDPTEQVASRLTEFYSRRWGLPPCITQRPAVTPESPQPRRH